MSVLYGGRRVLSCLAPALYRVFSSVCALGCKACSLGDLRIPDSERHPKTLTALGLGAVKGASRLHVLEALGWVGS